MARSQNSFNKREREKLKEKKRKEKESKKLAKKENQKSSSFEDMIAYVDQNGNIVSEPPDKSENEKVDPESIEISVPKKEKVEDEDKTGTVVYFNQDKGYGFIQDSRTQDKVFVHINQVSIELKEGIKVSYEIEKGPKGYIAVNVQMANSKKEEK